MGKKILYRNGKILTMDRALPTADYVLTEDDRISAVGLGMPGKELTKADEQIDLGGCVMVPGFIDSHIHMLTAALNRLRINIGERYFDSVDDMLRSLRDECGERSAEWLSIFGFSEENIASGEMVTRKALDRYFPKQPVTVIRVCGHLCVVNSEAIGRLDPKKMEQIRDGAFLKDENGEYNGLATEGAQQYVLDSMPAPDRETVIRGMLKEQDLLIHYGITSIHDAGTDMLPPREYVKLYQEMDRRGLLRLRTSLMVRPGEEESFAEFSEWLSRQTGEKEARRLKLGAVKLFADGSFGSRTAAVSEPYEGEAENRGLLLRERPERYIPPAADAGIQVAVHSIGDRATAMIAGLYSRSEGRHTARLRIEHAELLDEKLIGTIRDNGILIMTQPVFLYEFGQTYLKNLGQERSRRIQPIRSLLEQGVNVGFGTDYPVDSADPLLGIRTAMERKAKDGALILNRAESIDFTEALRCYTARNAYAAFQERETGMIRRGMQADFAVISGLIRNEDGALCVPETASVDRTVIAGDCVWQRA